MEPDSIALARFLGNVGGSAACIILFFVAIANYVLERRAIRVVEALLFAVLATVFIVRTAMTFTPPLVSDNFATASIALLWLTALTILSVWGIMLGVSKWRSIWAAVKVQKLKEQIDGIGQTNDQEIEKGKESNV